MAKKSSKSSPKGGYTLPKASLAGKSRVKQPSSGVDRGQTIRNKLNTYVAEAISSIRTRSDVNEIIRTLLHEEGLFSSAANSMVALASKSGYIIKAYGSDGSMDTQVMSVAYNILDQIDTSHDYSKGFNDRQGLQELLATLMMDTIGTGGCGAELVLDKDFGPDRLVPVGYSTIQWASDGKGGRYPTQDSGKIKLDLPTVFIAEHNRLADEAYALSQLRPGLSNTIQFNSFLEDMNRAILRTGHSRLISTISQEAVKKMAPPEVSNDPEKMAGFFNSVKSAVEDALRDLEPEDALVSYDSVTHNVETVDSGKADYSSMMKTLGNLLGVSLKTPASVSGLRDSGSQALSNAETLIYLKVVEASRSPTEQVMSRALTLAVRLLGIDGYVKFEMCPINLRPDTELEAYRSSKQKRILEMLSYGIISDAQACSELGLRPQDLNGTFSGSHFYKPTQDSNQQGERQSSSGRALNPGTPASSGGGDR